MKKLAFLLAAIATLALVLVGCGSDTKESAAEASQEFSIGVTAGPHAEVMDFVAKEAEKQGFKIKVVEFND